MTLVITLLLIYFSQLCKVQLMSIFVTNLNSGSAPREVVSYHSNIHYKILLYWNSCCYRASLFKICLMQNCRLTSGMNRGTMGLFQDHFESMCVWYPCDVWDMEILEHFVGLFSWIHLIIFTESWCGSIRQFMNIHCSTNSWNHFPF